MARWPCRAPCACGSMGDEPDDAGGAIQLKLRYRLLIIPALGGDPDWLDLSPVSAETMGRSVAAGEATPTVLIRHQRPYVLLGPRDHRLPDLPGGIRYLQGLGLPVYDRIGGGSAVLLDQDCISFAVARPCRDLGAIARNYDELTAGVRLALRGLGLETEFGAAIGSYCEGPNDLLVGGLKVAGVAQSVRGGFALVSGMLLVRQDPVHATDLINRFYAAAGGEPDRRADVVTSMEARLGRPVSTTEIQERLLAGFASVFDLEPDRFTDAEKERARSLVPIRRMG